jgi:hypothetical protein
MRPAANIPAVSNVPAWLAAGLLACAAAVTVMAAQFVTVARSAQITLEAAVTPQGVTLRLLPAVAGTAPHVTSVSVALGDTSEPARPQADGSWLVPLPPPQAARDGKLEVFVSHDGIREVLSGPLPTWTAASSTASTAASAAARPAATTGHGSGLFGAHKQLAWWVLNITIVLIGVLAVSRRMS